ncbi:MAG: chemotaxis response regulator protein-glutamate methylesterase [Planctomycetaceae bacterium]|nr:chemotaxis response regulator protein-glutamate methylesterase [Planctomycetaceae bacterium]
MIKVLIVDDSAVVRRVLSDELSKAADIHVVGTAVDPFVAREKLLKLRPDVVTLDLEMPRMGGLAFLSKLMKYFPLPVVVVSSLTPQGSEAAMRALEAGAVDVVAKPAGSDALPAISAMLVDRIRAAAAARPARLQTVEAGTPKPPQPLTLSGLHNRLIAIGASTGGTDAIKRVLLGLPANAPATVVVQHMPAAFTAAFAKRLDQLCLMNVREALDGEPVEQGTALIAPGNRHMSVRRRGSGFVVQVKDGPMVHHQRPSVDVLFHSVAQQAGAAATGVILTGMGSDGAQGLLAMKEAGACTLAQDEASCVVFGMPKEAIAAGAVRTIAPVDQMANEILRSLAGGSGHAAEMTPIGNVP